MKIQTSNGWSCLPCSFAMAINMPVEDFIELIGHDGSEEVYEKLPGVKAGFHEQECIEVVQQLGYSCTPIEIVPQMMPVPGGPVRPIWFWPEKLTANPEDWNWQRFTKHLKDSRGVITGMKENISTQEFIGHAVAVCNGTVYDPQGRGFIYPIDDAHNYGFRIRAYWKIQETVDGRTSEDGAFNTSTEETEEV